MDGALAARLDRWLDGAGHPNRSEALSGLVRQELARESWDEGREAVAVISLVYDHHQPELLRKLSHAEHEHGRLIIASQHVHLDHHHCLQVLIARGEPASLVALGDKLRGFKGVRQSTISRVSAGARAC